MFKPKLKTIMIFTAGYVLGARAGRKRYEQLKGLTNMVWRNTGDTKSRKKTKK